MPGWATDMVGVFLGAALGAFFGYWASVRFAQRETKARRAVLLDTLREQLRIMPDTRGADDTGEHSLRAAILASALPMWALGALLSGDVLDARDDAELIQQIVLLEAWYGVHAEVVRSANLAPAADRTYWSEQLREVSTGLTACRNTTLEQMAKIK